MRYQFNDCLLDTDRFELSRSGMTVRIEPQALELLLFLVQERDHVLSREEINQEVWKGRVVSDAALSSRIKTLRQVLGDDGHARPRRLATQRLEGRSGGHASPKSVREAERTLHDQLAQVMG